MSSINLQTIPLTRKANAEEFRIYRAGLEWDLTDPIVIDSRADLKSESRWRERLEPYHHQVTNLITFCRRLPVTLLADDVGLGKTISAGLIISELIARSRISKILIVCPKLLGDQWREELHSKFDLPAEIATGRDLLKIDLQTTGAVITTYESARMYLESIPPDRFEMLVLDEAHKLRNLYGTANTPKVAQVFQKALEERRFRYVLMLTATPIQNRLWDLYSLVDLLTVARGHQNPFGAEGRFLQKYIADGREQARQLRPESAEDFRSIVYGYMSRIRRGDAKLYFPDRVVQMHKIAPSTGELQLIEAIAEPIQSLNRLAQISILQALTSSPEALRSQLNNMAKKGTVSEDLASTVRNIVANMPAGAKLKGLGTLIDKLKRENPERWRLVIFTERLETQSAIRQFLEEQGFAVGIINSASGPRNQETIARFRKTPPDYRIIVSTRAGSEGVNLQVANVLVNYDLPWNPMIVEQRIGRIQRLASEHATVVIFNITLSGTFEEHIVGRLMEKLQMASHAIGDIEALLSGAGLEDDNFEEKLRELVVAALAGKNYETATKLTVESIAGAKDLLEREQENINRILGEMDGAGEAGPRGPKLPPIVRSMGVREFTLAALENLGARVTPQSPGQYLAEENGERQTIYFEDSPAPDKDSVFYAPGTPAFQRLVDRVIASGIHDVQDVDQNPEEESRAIAREWASSFGGAYLTYEFIEAIRCFEGTALVRARATVAHDSYERLVEVACTPTTHQAAFGRPGLKPLPQRSEDPRAFAFKFERAADAAQMDHALQEFSRFYLERRSLEVRSAGDDRRKQKKLEDEFTPRFEMTLVGLEGKLFRRLKAKVKYELEGRQYESAVVTLPYQSQMIESPPLLYCEKSGVTAPKDCFDKCQISGKRVLRHLLTKSELSPRLALPEHVIECSLSGQRILEDEAEVSGVSGRRVARTLLRRSAVSGVFAEPNYFGRCEFSNADVLRTELETSEISGKRYRRDEKLQSVISGKSGHTQEFILCHETRQPLLKAEAEICEESGNLVRPGILEPCAVTNKRVLPSELDRCASSGKRALKRFFVASSISGANLLEQVAVRSAAGKYCAEAETDACVWSGGNFHPDDMRTCALTGIRFSHTFAASEPPPRLRPLVNLLDGLESSAAAPQLWESIKARIASAIGNDRCRVESASFSPDQQHLAVCVEARTLWGLRSHQVGCLFDLRNQTIAGRVVQGKRGSKGWVERG